MARIQDGTKDAACLAEDVTPAHSRHRLGGEERDGFRRYVEHAAPNLAICRGRAVLIIDSTRSEAVISESVHVLHLLTPLIAPKLDRRPSRGFVEGVIAFVAAIVAMITNPDGKRSKLATRICFRAMDSRRQVELGHGELRDRTDTNARRLRSPRTM